MPARNTFAATRRSHAILQRLQQGEGVTIDDVSKSYNIQYPQARADLKLLEELYDLHTYREGRTKVWELPGVNTPEATVGIAAALELGGVALDLFKHTPYGRYIDSLADQWRERIGTPYSERLKRLSSALILRRTWLPTDETHLVEVLEEILDCFALRRGLQMRYERSDGEVSTYRVIPRRLIWYQGRLWLQAVEEDAQKLFDVAGILEASYFQREVLIRERSEAKLAHWLEEQGEEPDQEAIEARRLELFEEEAAVVNGLFEYGSRDEEDAYFANSFGIFASNFNPQRVELLVSGSWATYFRRYRIHPSQENEESEEGLKVQLELGLCPEFLSFLAGMIPDVRILSPQSLRDELVQRVQSWQP